MVTIPDIIEVGLSRLPLAIKVKHATYNGTRTRLFSDNWLHARAGLPVTIAGDETVISSADPDGYWIEIVGDWQAERQVILSRPFFFHGTQLAVQSQLSKLRAAQKYPLVWLYEPIEEDFDADDGRADADVRLFFLDNANYQDWTTDQHYAQVIKPQRRLADLVFSRLRLGIFGGVSEAKQGTIINRARWGTMMGAKGSMSSVFNENLSGCELAFGSTFYCQRAVYLAPAGAVTPGVPRSLAFVPSYQQISLAWMPPTSGADSYDIFVGGAFLANTANTAYDVGGLTPGTSYLIQVRSRLGELVSSFVGGNPQTLAVPPVLNLQGTPGITDVALAWDAPISGADSYRVLRGQTEVGTPFGTSFTDENLDPDTAYTYTVIPILGGVEGPGVEVQVTTQEAPPAVGPTASFSFTVDGLEVIFQDTSTEGDAALVGWAWDFGDTVTSTEQNPLHTYANLTDTYTVSLTVTDGNGLQDTATAQVSVEAIPVPEPVGPTAAFSVSGTGLARTFTNESIAGDAAIVSYLWNFGDATTSTQQSPTHTYADATQVYNVSLTVTDADTLTDVATESVQIVSTPPNVLTYVEQTDSFLAPNGRSYPNFTWAGMRRTGGRPDPVALNWVTVSVASDAELKTAVNAHKADGARPGTVITLSQSFPVTGRVDINNTSNLIIRGLTGNEKLTWNNSVPLPSTAGGGAYFWCNGGRNFENWQTTTEVRNIGDKTVTMSGSHGMQPGMWVYMQANQPANVVGRYSVNGGLSTEPGFRMVNQVEAVNGNEVTFLKPLRIKRTDAFQFNTIRSYNPVEYIGFENFELDYEDDPGGGRDGIWFNGAINCWLDGVIIRRFHRHPIGHGYLFSAHLEIENCIFSGGRNLGGGGNGYWGARNVTDQLMSHTQSFGARHGINYQEYAHGCVCWMCEGEESDTQFHSRFPSTTLIDMCQVWDGPGVQNSTGEEGTRTGYINAGDSTHDVTGARNVYFASGLYRLLNFRGAGLGAEGPGTELQIDYCALGADPSSFGSNYHNVNWLIGVGDYVHLSVFDTDFYGWNAGTSWAVAFKPGFVPYSENPSNWGYVSPNTGHPTLINSGQAGSSDGATLAQMNAAIYRPSEAKVSLIDTRFHGVQVGREIAGGLNDPNADPLTVLEPGSNPSFSATVVPFNHNLFDPQSLAPTWAPAGLYPAQLAALNLI